MVVVIIIRGPFTSVMNTTSLASDQSGGGGTALLVRTTTVGIDTHKRRRGIFVGLESSCVLSTTRLRGLGRFARATRVELFKCRIDQILRIFVCVVVWDYRAIGLSFDPALGLGSRGSGIGQSGSVGRAVQSEWDWIGGGCLKAGGCTFPRLGLVRITVLSFSSKTSKRLRRLLRILCCLYPCRVLPSIRRDMSGFGDRLPLLSSRCD